MDEAGKVFTEIFKDIGATKILTAEISGIAPAMATGKHMNLPVVFARKHKQVTMPNLFFLTLAPSHTEGRTVELIVSPEYLTNGEKVLIIDDFLASGATILGLVRLTELAGGTVVGVGALIEKGFEGGRSKLEKQGFSVKSLACIASLDENGITFGEGY